MLWFMNLPGVIVSVFIVPRPARGGGGYLGPRLVRGARNLGKTSGDGCDCQEGWGPVMCNHLLVLGPDLGSLV